MMTTISFVYISLSGNTANFVGRLSSFLQTKHPDIEMNCIHVKDLIKNKQPFIQMRQPFIAFLPTYLEGGNGIDSGDVEILTTDLADFIAFEENFRYCLGIVGSGNRNFNHQYCLSAKQYAKRFGFPLLATFELRGLQADVEHIGALVEQLYHLTD